MRLLENLDEEVRSAIKFFWGTRDNQTKAQLAQGAVHDHGTRSAVTGGAQMNGFVTVVEKALHEAGVPASSIFHGKRKAVIPGFFRVSKDWDLLVVHEGHLVAAIEFKSQVGSFGNNYNNRTEEALGSATDLSVAYREGTFSPSPKPWIGWIMLLQDSDRSRSPVTRVPEPHFPIRKEFKDASYAKRYELLCMKMVRESIYDGAAFLTTAQKEGRRDGHYDEPNEETSMRRFLTSLTGHATAIVNEMKNL